MKQIQLSECGIHRPPVAGMHTNENAGAMSIVLNGGYKDDIDNGEEFFTLDLEAETFMVTGEQMCSLLIRC